MFEELLIKEPEHRGCRCGNRWHEPKMKVTKLTPCWAKCACSTPCECLCEKETWPTCTCGSSCCEPCCEPEPCCDPCDPCSC